MTPVAYFVAQCDGDTRGGGQGEGYLTMVNQ
jgi:hypothetical protein